MVIPPIDDNPEKYFKTINELKHFFRFTKNLSMGMSADYQNAN